MNEINSNEVKLRFKIINYPFMGTDVDTENLLLTARLCYKPIGVDDIFDMVNEPIQNGEKKESTGKFIRRLIKSGHYGALEHWYTTFAVEGYSRISSQQNDRHRLMKMFKDPGVPSLEWANDGESGSPDTSQLQQSQRYVNEDNFKYVVPPSFEKNPGFLERFRELQDEIRDLQKFGLDSGLPAEDVRFSLTNATETRFIITTNARQLRHMFNLRCCVRAQWEIRELFDGLLAEYKRIAPNIFWKAGASCDDKGYCPEGSMCCGRAKTLEQILEENNSK